MSVKPTHIEVYTLEEEKLLFILRASDKKTNLIQLFMSTFQEELPSLITVEIYMNTFLLRYRDINLHCDGCFLKKTQSGDDICKLCLANFLFEEIKNLE